MVAESITSPYLQLPLLRWRTLRKLYG